MRAGRVEADDDIGLVLAEEVRAVGAGKRGDVAGIGESLALGLALTVTAIVVNEIDARTAAPCTHQAAVLHAAQSDIDERLLIESFMFDQPLPGVVLM